ncbi:MAG: hypothetical protein F4Z95_11185 [Gammaproteobacteria bacterium]|nr:hypothetical protein [Gammaproteobacteria bacterium]
MPGAGSPPGFAPGFRIPAAVEFPPALRLRVSGALGGAALLTASGAESAAGFGIVGSTLRAHTAFDAFGGLPAGPLTLICASALLVPARLAGGAQPRIARTAGGTGFPGASAAQASTGFGRAPPASGASPGGPAFGRPTMVARPVPGSRDVGVSVGHGHSPRWK